MHESHDAPRGQKAPLPGTRPGLPPELAPQVRLEAAARALVVDGLPTFALPVLAGSAGEAIHSGTLSFLLQKQLAPVVEEEEEEAQLVVDVPESVEWVQLSNPTGKIYYCNRRSGKTAWNPPEDLKVVWCGRRDAEGEGITGTRSLVSVRTSSLHFLPIFLGDGFQTFSYSAALGSTVVHVPVSTDVLANFMMMALGSRSRHSQLIFWILF